MAVVVKVAFIAGWIKWIRGGYVSRFFFIYIYEKWHF